MRMRKVGWAVEYLDRASCLVKNPASLKGKWKQILDADKLHVELGCGKGRYSLEYANQHPDDGFVAVEVNESAAGMAVKKFDEQGQYQNLLGVHGDARNLGEWFDTGEVDVIHLNFSDPWPKKRNAKRRLSSKAFVEAYREVLSQDGRIEMKTDNKDLFEYSVAQFSQNGFVIDELSVDYRRNEHPEDPITEYEQKFMDASAPIYRVVLRKGKVE